MGGLVQGPDGLQHIEPALPVTAVKSYLAASPRRRATCAEVRCGAYLHGWKTIVPADGPQAHYIRAQSGRGFTEARLDGGLAEFTFEPGQPCFAASTHGLPAEGAERFAERGGDWRGVTSEVIRHSPQGWADSFGEHQERIAEAIERG